MNRIMKMMLSKDNEEAYTPYPKLNAKELCDVMPINTKAVFKSIAEASKIKTNEPKEKALKRYNLQPFAKNDGTLFDPDYTLRPIYIDDLMVGSIAVLDEWENLWSNYGRTSLHVRQEDIDRIKELWEDGDVLYSFASPSWTWSSLCGRAGVALTRKDKIVFKTVTRMS